MPHSYLPRLKPGATFADPATTSVWDERSNRQLSALAASIEIPPSTHRIHSIPDPWARAILFDRALFDPDHTLHRTVLGEWRGLLALLGLRERRQFTGLSAGAVTLAAPRPGTFSAVLSQLKPASTHTLVGDGAWDKLYVFRWAGRAATGLRPRAFAFSSPSTIVCTGADYGEVLSPADVPWFNRGTDDRGRPLLRDPKEYLGQRERRALAEWVLMVAGQLTDLASGSAQKNRVLGALRTYAAELDAQAGLLGVDEALSLSSLGLDSGIYRAINRPRVGEVRGGSDVEILKSADREKKDTTRYLLIDPSLAQQWHVSPQEITIHGDVTLATSERLTASGKREIEHGVVWCTPDFFFADRLICDPTPTAAFPACLPVKFSGVSQPRSVVLPLNPDVLKLFTPHELAERLTIEWLPDGRATCHLQLLLRTGTEKPRMCRIQKTFAETQIVNIANLPLVATWPNFRLEGVPWSTYYLFQFWSAKADELSVRPWSEAEPEAKGRAFAFDVGRRFQVFRTSTHPEALLCETPYFDASIQREAKARGILLLQLPAKTQPAPSSSMVLGVDFGSTGTNVYVRAGTGTPEPLVFRKRILQITDFDTGRFLDACRDYFIPDKDWAAESILSVFHDFGQPADGDSTRLVLRDGHILYADDPSKFVAVSDRRRVRSNLKWGAADERVFAQEFLMQVCLQAAAEVAFQGASSVDVRFSYPTAFSKYDWGNFHRHWDTVTRKVSDLTGISFVLNETVETREAVTATRFFADRVNKDRLDVVGGALTMDIGGGTTDIAIWKEMQLLAHSSVVMAGRDVFLAAVRRRPEILNEIYQNVPLDTLKGAQRDGAFDAQLDAIVAKHGDAMIGALAMVDDRRSVQGLLAIIEVGLCGLVFYSGLLVRRLIEAGAFPTPKRLDIRLVSKS